MIQQIPHNHFDTGYYRWKHRLLLLFSPSWDDPDYLAQTRKFKTLDDEFYGRDLLLFTFMPSSPANELATGRHIMDSADHWRQFGLVPHTFAVLLIDKDGGVQLRSTEPVEPDLLFALIDNAPVREPDGETELVTLDVTS
ncbi:MAG TPA: DUF4174 domain-containing protein [Anaerohalosphaeraceae bacterium]|jgi:hypothetical protein|nr:DUF4174 domain-containing protein [Anaerohalosphaeraceae bacterium]HRT49573.1 DUF4174 domain-containing protein [Anaerohalosphaeraceae bacterium]HRT85492.1 DUF4174 domain-containing protein [Anaerohalosphaeraceae bacterium]